MYLTINDVAARLKLSYEEARRLVRGVSGKPPIPHTRISWKTTRIAKRDFEKWCRENVVSVRK